jgi:hypothetical protein
MPAIRPGCIPPPRTRTRPRPRSGLRPHRSPASILDTTSIRARPRRRAGRSERAARPSESRSERGADAKADRTHTLVRPSRLAARIDSSSSIECIGGLVSTERSGPRAGTSGRRGHVAHDRSHSHLDAPATGTRRGPPSSGLTIGAGFARPAPVGTWQPRPIQSAMNERSSGRGPTANFDQSS